MSLTLNAIVKPDPSTDCLTSACEEPPYTEFDDAPDTAYVAVPYCAARSVDCKGYTAGLAESGDSLSYLSIKFAAIADSGLKLTITL